MFRWHGSYTGLDNLYQTTKKGHSRSNEAIASRYDIIKGLHKPGSVKPWKFPQEVSDMTQHIIDDSIDIMDEAAHNFILGLYYGVIVLSAISVERLLKAVILLKDYNQIPKSELEDYLEKKTLVYGLRSAKEQGYPIESLAEYEEQSVEFRYWSFVVNRNSIAHGSIDKIKDPLSIVIGGDPYSFIGSLDADMMAQIQYARCSEFLFESFKQFTKNYGVHDRSD